MATVLSNLVGRTARPSTETPWCWPWAWKFEPKGPDADAARAEDRLDALGRYKKTLYAERAKVVAVRADKDGVKATLENAAGEMAEVFVAMVALVPEEVA